MKLADNAIGSLSARWTATWLAVVLMAGILSMWPEGRRTEGTLQAVLLVTLAGWLVLPCVSGLRVRVSLLMLPPAGIVSLALLQIVTGTTLYRWATVAALLDWAARLAVFFLALQAGTDAAAWRRFRRLILWFAYALSVQAVFQHFTAPGRVLWLFETPFPGGMGPFVYHNQYAAFVELVLPLAVVTALREREARYLHGVGAAWLMASVVLANSRAGVILAAASGILALVVEARRSGRVRPRAVLAVAGALALFLVVFGWSPFVTKLRQQEPYKDRRLLLISTLEMALDRPVLGVGLGNWSLAYPAYARFDDGLFDNQAHNDWAQWAAEGGFPLLGLMLWFAAALTRHALRARWGVGLIFVLVHCLLEYHFQQRPAFGYLYFALAGFAVAESRWLAGRVSENRECL